jgi:CRISPR system Cascade subunit CasB
MEQQELQKQTRGQAFVQFVLKGMERDTGFGAVFRRADNPDTEYQAWKYLARWCDLDNSRERVVFATVGAALAKAKPGTDGTLGIGRAIARCYSEGATDGNQSDNAKAELRRLLSCDTREEACRILRPLLQLIPSKLEGVGLCYGNLLTDLLYFGEGIKQKRGVDFYGRRQDDHSLDV